MDAFIESEQAEKAVEVRGTGEAAMGKKRTREEIVQELKRQRTGAGPSEAAPVQETLGSKVSLKN